MSGEPYRPFFILGLLGAVIGVGLWPVDQLGWIEYPLAAHGQIMIYGFLLSFVTGFLMTALPRYSGTPAASRAEVVTGLSVIAGSMILSLCGRVSEAYLTSAAAFLLLAIFILRRVRQRQNNPPNGFIFVPFGLLWGALGALIQGLMHGGYALPLWALEAGRIGAQHGFILHLILGIGSRLVPHLTHQVRPVTGQPWSEAMWHMWIVLVGLNVSFAVEFVSTPVAWGVRAAIMFSAWFTVFGLHRARAKRTRLAWLIQASVAGMFVGYLLLMLWPYNPIPLVHILFIAGFAMLTLAVAVRVVLAHGGSSLDSEHTSTLLPLLMILLTIAAVLRAQLWIQTSAAVWFAAIAVWSLGYGRALFRKPT